MTQKLYNVATHPELASISLGTIHIVWTRHATAQAIRKNVSYTSFLTVPAGAVVEVSHDASPPRKSSALEHKLVVRLPGEAGWDNVYVLICKARTGRYIVATCWTNRTIDRHATLNMARISA
jgi:hypothetical protein